MMNYSTFAPLALSPLDEVTFVLLKSWYVRNAAYSCYASRGHSLTLNLRYCGTICSTVEDPNKAQIGSGDLVLYSEVVLISEVAIKLYCNTGLTGLHIIIIIINISIKL